MAIMTKIKHVDLRPNGVLRFRRRFPQDVAGVLGKDFLQVHIRNRDGAAFFREYQAIMSEFERMVSETRARLKEKDMRPAIERWREALLQREGLIAEASGLEDDPEYAARLIAHGLAQRPDTDPLLIKALVNPSAEAPAVTLRDAANVYAKDKRLTGDKDEMVRFERTLQRLQQAIGPLDQVPLKALSREQHGRKFMSLLLNAKKSDGKPLALGSAKREAIIVAAIVNHAFKEFDLEGTIGNPFASLPWPKEDVRAMEKKLPLPDDLVGRIYARLEGGRTRELPLVWRLLAGTGMRLGEAVGLTRDDIILDAVTPHVLVRPNAVRGLKTAASIRSVPLVGEALKAATEAVEGVAQGTPLFARYARPRGADGASAALMKAVRAETDDKRFTVHGLRHRVSDRLRDAGAPVEVRHGFLGHASTAIAETTYGSREARLREFAKWAESAGL